MSTVSSASARRRAIAATTLFGTAGAAGLGHGVRDWSVAAPLTGIYALLVLNTYHSVRCFSTMPAAFGRSQRAFDGTLALLYLALAASLDDVARFASFGTLLFAVATLKYASLLDRAEDGTRLTRKIRVDSAGTIAAAAAAVAASGGHGLLACWSLLGVSALAHVYVLWARPLYREAPAGDR